MKMQCLGNSLEDNTSVCGGWGNPDYLQKLENMSESKAVDATSCLKWLAEMVDEGEQEPAESSWWPHRD